MQSPTPRDDVYTLVSFLAELDRVLHPLQRGSRGRVRVAPNFPPSLPGAPGGGLGAGGMADGGHGATQARGINLEPFASTAAKTSAAPLESHGRAVPHSPSPKVPEVHSDSPRHSEAPPTSFGGKATFGEGAGAISKQSSATASSLGTVSTDADPARGTPAVSERARGGVEPQAGKSEQAVEMIEALRAVQSQPYPERSVGFREMPAADASRLPLPAPSSRALRVPLPAHVGASSQAAAPFRDEIHSDRFTLFAAEGVSRAWSQPSASPLTPLDVPGMLLPTASSQRGEGASGALLPVPRRVRQQGTPFATLAEPPPNLRPGEEASVHLGDSELVADELDAGAFSFDRELAEEGRPLGLRYASGRRGVLLQLGEEQAERLRRKLQVGFLDRALMRNR